MGKTFFGPTALGIDIGDDHLKLALVSQGLTPKVTLIGLLSQPLDPGVIVKGLIENPQAVQETIIQGLKRFKLDLHDVIASVSVPQEKVYLTTIPTEHQLAPADISVIAEEHFPLQAKEAEIRSVSFLKNTEHWSVLAAVDKESIQRLIQTCDSVGLKIGAIEFDALALTRLLRFETSEPDLLLILDIGATHATLIAFHTASGLFSEFNIKSMSGELLTKTIATALHIQPDQAEALKRMYGLVFSSPQQQLPVTQAMQTLATGLATELNSFLGFLATHHKSTIPLDIPIMLVGGSAQTRGLPELLSQALNRKVLNWKPANRFKLIPKMPPAAYAAFAVSIGTAIRILQYE